MDPNIWRKDICGAWMGRYNYGDHKSEYGWEIELVTGDGNGKGSVLLPRQWQNDEHKKLGVTRLQDESKRDAKRESPVTALSPIAVSLQSDLGRERNCGFKNLG